MKQLVQNIRTGESVVADVPAPAARSGEVLIAVSASLVSAGTERMVVDFASKNVLEKARSRPDLVRQTFEKARRDGVLPTIDAVRNRLDQPMALGYSVAGVVVDVGADVTGFARGDRVAAAGAGQAVHAEVVAVPQNLVVKVPDGVAFDVAAFTTVGAIALQGVRLAEPHLGESVAVLGLGLLGQITVQLLRANGCRVVGFDPKGDRAELARRFGAEAAVSDADALRAACAAAGGGRGVDAVLITADTSSDEPIATAGEIAREKGIVVAVGAVGLHIPRKLYYEKELRFIVSRSYGPGRYDDSYEQGGIDYPYAYVRWTENRNMEAFLRLAGDGSVDLNSLITHRIDIADAARAYELITGKGEPFLGVVLQYPGAGETAAAARRIEVTPAPVASGAVRIGVLGAGNFARSVLLPAFREAGAEMAGIAAATGVSARHAADRFQFRYCTTSSDEVLRDDSVNTIVIATRHDLHAAQTVRALEAGRHVFVEKPLCLDETELEAIRAAHEARDPRPLLMVGFNRRFAPMSIRLREFMHAGGEPLLIHYRANGGFIPATEWVQGPQGGGRLVGEGVHFIDWAVWLTGDEPELVHAVAADDAGRYSQDNVAVTIRFRRGSVLQLTYVASGDRAAGKERIEVHGGGRTALIEDFRRLELTAGGRRDVDRTWLRSDKGHRAAVRAFVDVVRTGGAPPIPFAEILTSMRATFAARESLERRRVVELPR